ncbi:MAG: hypothetical protein IJV55_02805 [Paludibacteraceae bacterium]|nr:hypothetical protein [Paludibacteraceae bacterium]
MKKPAFILCLLSVACLVEAQSAGALREYRRNALAEMLVYHSEDEFGKEIYEAFMAKPASDKYDDHNIGFSVVDNDSIANVKRTSHGLVKAKYGKNLMPSDIRKNAAMLEKVLNDNEVPKFMVAKWFGMDIDLDNFDIEKAHFSMDLIQERGQYNASELDVNLAKQTARGVAALSDAGEELIGNTFMLISDMTYVTAEEKAAIAKATLNALGSFVDAVFKTNLGSTTAELAGDIADSFTGFTVKTHSYLFQMDWNDSIAAIFYNNYYTAEPNPEKVMAFLMDTSTFRMHYVAHEYEYSEKSVIVGQYERPELIKMVCTRSIDKNIAALQLAYEDFKVKTPVYEMITNSNGKVTGYTAKIGLKEGISEKSKFQVVQRQMNPETNRTEYKYVATVKPEKGKIWDNRYNAVTEKSEGSELTATTFKKVAGGEILPGMLLIEGKYRKVKE